MHESAKLGIATKTFKKVKTFLIENSDCRNSLPKTPCPSQRSLHNAPIFRLLLKVAVNGTHQCDFQNFCGASGLQHIVALGIRNKAGTADQ